MVLPDYIRWHNSAHRLRIHNDIGPGNSNFTVTTLAPGGGTTAPIVYTAYIPIVNNSMVYNPVNQLFYLSIPSSAGAPYANSVVSLDPVTGAFGTPILVGSEPNKMALTSDGRYLWVGLDGANAVRKVDLVANAAGLQFALPITTNGALLTAVAMVAVPGQTDSVIVSAADLQNGDGTLSLYDSGVIRGSVLSTLASPILALQVDGSKSEVYAASSGTYMSYDTYTYDSSGLKLKISSQSRSM